VQLEYTASNQISGIDFEEIRFEINRFVSERPEDCVIQDNGNDFRIFNANKKLGANALKLYEFQKQIFKDETNFEPGYSFLMLAKILPSSSSLGSGDGWHRDSWPRNFKVFTYLSDCTNDDDGPFEIIDGSSHWSDKIMSFVRNGKSRRYKVVDEARAISIKGAAGFSFIANTDTIHRGRPVKIKPRYMATFYNYSGSKNYIKKKIAEYSKQ
jgi:hypothetical protein